MYSQSFKLFVLYAYLHQREAGAAARKKVSDATAAAAPGASRANPQVREFDGNSSKRKSLSTSFLIFLMFYAFLNLLFPYTSMFQTFCLLYFSASFSLKRFDQLQS